MREEFVKKTILSILLCFPLSGFAASHMDVIRMTLNEGCSLGDLLAVRDDFNVWGAEYGYQSRIAMPIQGEDLNKLYWIGESADAATFGAAWDTWRDALSDPESVPAKLWARFQACSTNQERWGYDVY